MNATDELSPRELVQRLCLMESAVHHFGWLRLEAIGRGDPDAQARAYRHQHEMLRHVRTLRTMLKAAAVAGVLALALLLSPGDGAGRLVRPVLAGPRRRAGLRQRRERGGMTVRVLRGDAHEPPYQVLDSAAESIEAISIKTADGEWRRVPESWQGEVELCGAKTVYRLKGHVWRAKCCTRSDWICGAAGLCGFHFLQALEVGA